MSGMIPIEFRGRTAAADRAVAGTYRSVQNWECSRKVTDNGNGPQQHKTTGLPEREKPAAGGGAAGFSKRTDQQLGGGVLLILQAPLGGGVRNL